MRLAFLVVVFVIQEVCLAQGRFILESELRTNYGDGAPVSAFTAYHYDGNGNRTDRRVFDGMDSTAALMSIIRYSYNAQDRCDEELLLDADDDTLSIVRYTYGSDGMTSAVTLRKDGSVRFSDSLRYDGGSLSEQRRYNSSGACTYYHRYGYEDGLLASDSLYEPDGSGGFEATRARLMSYNADSTVSAEAQWRVSEGQWYIISTTMMAYEQKNLVSATTYETDGATKRLMDSLAYALDSYGNRVKEEHFDNERTKTYDIVYTWQDTQPSGVRADSRRIQPMRMTWNKRRLDFGAPMTGSFALLRPDGRRVYEQRIGGTTSVLLAGRFPAGRYIAMVEGKGKQSMMITIYQ